MLLVPNYINLFHVPEETDIKQIFPRKRRARKQSKNIDKLSPKAETKNIYIFMKLMLQL